MNRNFYFNKKLKIGFIILLFRYARTVHLRHAEAVIRLYPHQLFDASALLFRVRFGADTEHAERRILARVEPHLLEDLGQTRSITRDDVQSRRTEVHDEFDLPFRVARCSRHR